MRWQAMDVRWEQAGASPVATGLPSPFVELGENGMGEAASHCEAARLLPTFKTAVLKLAPADKTTEPAVEGAVLSGIATAVGGLHVGRADQVGAAGGGTDDDAEEECVVSIDHMNDRTGYVRHLQRWCGQLGLGGRTIHGGSRHQSRRVVLVLHGARSGCREFVQRLRTQMVDVDRGGRACRERQATVCWQRPRVGVDLGMPASLVGFSAIECEDEAGVRAALLEVGMSGDDLAELDVST